MRRTLFVVGGAVVVLLGIVGVFGWQQVTASATVNPVRTQTVSVTRGTLVANVNAAGNVSAPGTAALAFPSSGRVIKIAVQVGDTVKKGALLAQLDTADLQLALRTAQTNLATAQTNFDSTQANLQFALRTAQGNLATAQANYDGAKAKYGTLPEQLIVAKMALEKARVALEQAQGAYDAVAWRSDVGMTSQAAALQTATSDYSAAQANYDIAAAAINDTSLRTAQATLDNALVALDQAQKNVDTSTRTTQASLDSAKVALEQAQRNLDKASLYAPLDGVISAVNFSTGDTAGSGPAVSLVDLSDLQVKVMVAEVDMARLQAGQTVMISVDALPGKMYHGEVTAIGPVGSVMQGVVNYPVIVVVSNPDPDIKPGMTANLAVQVDRRAGVLLAPLRAVRTQGNQKVVTVDRDGQSIQVPVTTGLSNDTQVEITSGVREGDVLVLVQTQTTQPNANMPGGMFLMGGGGGGGMH